MIWLFCREFAENPYWTAEGRETEETNLETKTREKYLFSRIEEVLSIRWWNEIGRISLYQFKNCGKFLYTLIIALLNKLLATEIKRFLVLVTHYEKVTVSQILFSHSSCS